MSYDQLPLFQRKTYKGIIPGISIEIPAPEASKTIMQTLPVYYAYLMDGGFSKYTPDDFSGDLKKFGVYLKEKPVKDITDKDVLGWISFLKTPQPRGEGLSAKTVSRKLTALGNYFQWLAGNGAIHEKDNPMRGVANFRISSPLPEILFEEECGRLLITASTDPRTYLIFLLLLETGLKLEELFRLKVSSFDFSNKYSPEVYIRHTGKNGEKIP